MTASDKQWQFFKDLAMLVLFAVRRGDKLTLKEVLRTTEQQKIYYDSGKSKTMDGIHLRGGGADMVLFPGGGGIPSWSKKDYQPYGDHWKSLSPHNSWGGDFKGFGKEGDSCHFERSDL